MTNNVFWTKTSNRNNNKTKNKNTCLSKQIEPGTSRIAVWCDTSGPQRQMNVLVVIKLINCSNVVSHNINKQRQICGPHFFLTKSHFQ